MGRLIAFIGLASSLQASALLSSALGRSRCRMSTAGAAEPRTLAGLFRRAVDSLKGELDADGDNAARYPNRESRECDGHWVEVEASPLPDPYLVSYSPEMAAALGLDPGECETSDFARVFSGDMAPVGARPWATPYAVSVFGHPIMSPDPFGRGNGYGDGRALTLGEFECPDGARWELQLKGAGTTPFSRNGDGRAVLRSSIREYLVSEAMEHLGVPTTRALCLVASQSARVRRLWYRDGDNTADHPPDTLVQERCAITCRAAPSFLRVGHLELHSRRAAMGVPGAPAQLEALVRHAIRREFSEVAAAHADDLRAQLLGMVRAFAARQAHLAVSWLRVGYVQGNMNSDNCLLSGRTMDYGPFGFVEAYEALWSPFTSDMERKFGFERQPLAAQVNLLTLAKALLPLFDRLEGGDAIEELQGIVQEGYSRTLKAAHGDMASRKLGLSGWDEGREERLWKPLQGLMERSRADYTILFRQLSHVGEADLKGAAAGDEAAAASALAKLAPAFYEEGKRAQAEGDWKAWLREWASAIAEEGLPEGDRVDRMRAASPKYIPREWMLVRAYRAAEAGDHSVLHELEELFKRPYDEQPDMEGTYYAKTPPAMQQVGGVSYFS